MEVSLCAQLLWMLFCCWLLFFCTPRDWIHCWVVAFVIHSS